MRHLERQVPQVGDSTGSGHFRPDIEGLRAVAVILVIAYHSGLPFLSGGYVGVDVFFVISGFLITGLLVRELESTGTITLGTFYLRRARRLLPAAALTLLGVGVLTVAALPLIRWVSVARDIRWSALYAVNWRFASQATDYLAAEEAASPVQHFWSLAVEEQFYLVWPLLLLALGLAATRWAAPRRPILMLGLLAVGLPSFVWSVQLTATEPARAFFVSTTRAWELAVGGALAVGAPLLARLPYVVSAALAWVGLGGVVLAGVVLGPTTLFPGWSALLPVMSAAALIASGTAGKAGLPARILSARPSRFVGSMSYSLYLWHWPLLVTARAAWGPIGPWSGLGVSAVAILPAWLAYRFVERRWHHSDVFLSPPRRGLGYGLALTLVGVTVGVVLTLAVPGASAEAQSDDISAARSETTLKPLVGRVQRTADILYPDPVDARADLPAVYEAGCHQEPKKSEITTCHYGNPGSEVEVVIVGDSHAAQWIPALRFVAGDQGWLLTTMTKSGCPFAEVVIGTREQNLPDETCVQWNQNVLIDLDARRPDLVIVTNAFWPNVLGPDGPLDAVQRESVFADAVIASWSALMDKGIGLTAIQDTPHPRIDVPECVVTHRDDLLACAVDRKEAMEGNSPYVVAARSLDVGLVDLTDYICFAEVCPAVVDDILVWRDSHHLTRTYSSRLGPVLADVLGEVAPNPVVSGP